MGVRDGTGQTFESPLGTSRMLSDCSEDAPMAPYPEWTLEESRAGTGLRQLVGHWRVRPAQNEAADAYEYCEPALHAPRRWGLWAEAVAHLGDRLCQLRCSSRGKLRSRRPRPWPRG